MKTLVNDGLRFACSNEAELWRARTLLTKEPGTIQWLRDNVRPGDVFYDIGANVGCYTLYAAKLGATVYAFEPHPANAAALLRNISLNPDASARVMVVTAPLHDRPSWQEFKLGASEPGTSGSTLGQRGNVLQWATTIDAFVEHNLLPSILKIDVDGNEDLIVSGMARTMGLYPPRHAQIECEPAKRAGIASRMEGYGYIKTGRHFTKDCQARIDAGADPATVIENAIFERAA